VSKPTLIMNKILIFLLLAGLWQSAPAQTRIVVAQDGSGAYKTVQEAFDHVPAHNTKPIEIFLKNGVYQERVVLDSTKNFVRLIGEDSNKTIITFNNHAGMTSPTGKRIGTPESASFFIYAHDFTARNITFQNDAGFTAGQAVAVLAHGDRLIFDNCRFIGFQDVLYAEGERSRQYYHHCYIEGTTDFIFGPSTAVFDRCHIHSKKNSHVTAASTSESKKYGFVFLECKLTADTALHSVSLGRPWKPYASVAYIRCNIGPHVIPGGWNNWSNPANETTVRFAEYKSNGPSANPYARVQWSRQLTKNEADQYTVKNILAGSDNWVPKF
jgi:pectinesterase